MKRDLPPILRVLEGERLAAPPAWIMRQAGRYLPEYRELRARARTFLEFCYAPSLATEATLQPLRRFPLDAAIIFSDILTVPDALGREVRFVEGEGPRLAPLLEEERAWTFEDPVRALQRLEPVYEAIGRVRQALDPSVALLGFAGAPWTVATYMLQGQGGGKEPSRRAAYERPSDVAALLDVLVETTAQHLAAQVRAGADAVQVFESWAEDLPGPLFERLVIAPTQALVLRLRALGCSAKVIGFPRGCGLHLGRYAHETGVDALGLDLAGSASLARTLAPEGMPLQGNLDPQVLVAGGSALRRATQAVLRDFAGGPHIFNLGHGITPDAKPEHLAEVLAIVRGDHA